MAVEHAGGMPLGLPDSPTTPSKSKLTLSDFLIVGKLGEGGFGTVLLVRLKATGKLYALKLLLKDNIDTSLRADRVLREAHAMMDSVHPFIVQLHGAFTDEQYVYFVMEYLGGGDLFGYVSHRPGGALKGDSARVAAAEIALALHALHSFGYMYRDLKPENVLVGHDGHLKLADMGLVKKFRRDALPGSSTPDSFRRRVSNANTANGARTRQHSKVGTPDWVAPEMMGLGMEPGEDYDVSIDWWALGVLLGELITGEVPLTERGTNERSMDRLLIAYEHNEHIREDLLSRIDTDAADVIRGLLTVRRDRRLGCGAGGFAKLKAHPFFQGLNWDAVMHKEVPPPLPALVIEERSTSASLGSPPSPVIGRRRRNSEANPEALLKIEQNLVNFLDAPAQEVWEAVAEGDDRKLRELIHSGCHVNQTDGDRRTPLHHAASAGSLEAVKLLLDAGAELSPYDKRGKAPIDDALEKRHSKVVEHLSSLGAESRAGQILTPRISPTRSSSNSTSSETDAGELCDAAATGDLMALRILITSGKDVNQGNHDKRTALHLAASEGLLKTVQFLTQEAGADPSPIDRWEGTPLDDAIRAGGTEHHAIVVFLKSIGAKRGKTARIGTSGAPDASAQLCLAAHAGDVALVKRLVQEDGADANKGNFDGRTALHLAAAEGHYYLVRMLLGELRVLHSPLDRWGHTPLDDAVRSGDDRTIDLLMDEGATHGNEYMSFGNSTHGASEASSSRKVRSRQDSGVSNGSGGGFDSSLRGSQSSSNMCVLL